jgi:2-amino-4-hydroxy-6-hydroxymethyldihydropteridine diphosphokinase
VDNIRNEPEEHLVFIALGTNLGDRLANLQTAIRLLPPNVKLVAQSPVYQTTPWGYEDQPDFLNQVIQAETSLPPEELLADLKEIEIRVGRKPSFRYGPRVVDMDILFYDKLVLDQSGLQIPHPRLHERAFVLVPLHDLAPELKHPVLNATVGELLSGVDVSEVTPFAYQET